METVNIIGHNNLIRDLESKALLCTDTGAIERYQRQTKIFENAKKQADDIDSLKKQMDQIQKLLETLLLRNNN